jgi:transmembrane sensor
VSQFSTLPDHLIDAAIAWAIKLNYNAATAQTKAEFERWLHHDPLHQLAWQRVGSLPGSLQAQGMSPRLARQALGTAEQLHRRHSAGRRDALKLLSLAAVAVGTGWVVHEQAPWQRLMADASTRVSEQRSLTLTDGSLVQLNTDTAIRSDLSGPKRVVQLYRGEIQVTTGADVEGAARWEGSRPFWVHTPFGRMRALGTRFTVRLYEDRARISVQEGAVQLHPALTGETFIVHPGETYWLARDSTRLADLKGIEPDAWTGGVVIGKDMRLADLLAEIARYRPGRVDCDERVAGLRVSGLYHVKDTDQALQFLVQTQPISVTMTTRFWVRIGPAS